MNISRMHLHRVVLNLNRILIEYKLDLALVLSRILFGTDLQKMQILCRSVPFQGRC
mgnify:CR=1 FL=1|jgi:hypothetical protein